MTLPTLSHSTWVIGVNILRPNSLDWLLVDAVRGGEDVVSVDERPAARVVDPPRPRRVVPQQRHEGQLTQIGVLALKDYHGFTDPLPFDIFCWKSADFAV